MASEVYFTINRKTGGFQAHCRSEGNNDEIWTTQVYKDKRSARHAIERMQVHAASGRVLDLTDD